MRSGEFRTVSKILSVYLIFALSGCSEGLKNHVSSTSSVAQAGPSPKAKDLRAENVDGENGHDGQQAAHDRAVRELYDQVISESEKVDDQIHFLRLMYQTSGTLAVRGMEYDAQKKKLTEIETEFQGWKKHVEAYLELLAEKFENMHKALDHKLELLSEYFIQYYRLAAIRQNLGFSIDETWRQTYGVAVPIILMAELSGFIFVDNYSNPQTIQQLFVSASKGATAAPTQDFSLVVMDTAKMKAGLQSGTFSFVNHLDEKVTLQLSDYAITELVTSKIASVPSEKAIVWILKLLAVKALYARFAENTRYQLNPPTEYPPVPKDIVAEYPMLENWNERVRDLEDRNTEAVQREALAKAFDYLKMPPMAPEPTAVEQAEKATPSAPSAPVSLLSSNAVPALSTHILANGSITNLSGSITNLSTNSAALANLAVPTLTPSTNQSATNLIASTNFQAQVSTNISLTATQSTDSGADSGPSLGDLLGGGTDTNPPPAMVATNPPLTVVTNPPVKGTNTPMTVTSPPSVAAKVPADGSGGPLPPDYYGPPMPTPLERQAMLRHSALASFREKAQKKGLEYVTDDFVTQLYALIEKSGDPQESVAKELGRKEETVASLRELEFDNLATTLPSLLLRWPVQFETGASEKVVLKTLRTILATAKDDSIGRGINFLAVSPETRQQIDSLRMNHAMEFSEHVPDATLLEWLNKSRIMAKDEIRGASRRIFVKNIMVEALKVEQILRNKNNDIEVSYPTLNAALYPYLIAMGTRGTTQRMITSFVSAPQIDSARKAHENLLEILLTRYLPKEKIRFSKGKFVDATGQWSHQLENRMKKEIYLEGITPAELAALRKAGDTMAARKHEAQRIQLVQLVEVGRLFGFYTDVTGRLPKLSELPLSPAEIEAYKTEYRRSLLSQSILTVKRKGKKLFSEELARIVWPTLDKLKRIPNPETSVRRQDIEAALPLLEPVVSQVQAHVYKSLEMLGKAKTPSEVIQLIGESSIAQLMARQYTTLKNEQLHVLESVLRELRDPNLFKEGAKSYMQPNQWLGGFFTFLLGSIVLNMIKPLQPVARAMAAPWNALAGQMTGYFSTLLPFMLVDAGWTYGQGVRKNYEADDLDILNQTSTDSKGMFQYHVIDRRRAEAKNLKAETMASIGTMAVFQLGILGTYRFQRKLLRSKIDGTLDDLERVGYTHGEIGSEVFDEANILKKAKETIEGYEAQLSGATPENTVNLRKSIASATGARDRLIQLTAEYQQQAQAFVNQYAPEYRLLEMAPGQESLNPYKIGELIAQSKSPSVVAAGKKIQSALFQEMRAMDSGYSLRATDRSGNPLPESQVQKALYEKHFFWNWKKTPDLAGMSQALSTPARNFGNTDFYALFNQFSEVPVNRESTDADIREAVFSIQRSEKYRGLSLRSISGDVVARAEMTTLNDAINVLTGPERAAYHQVMPGGVK